MSHFETFILKKRITVSKNYICSNKHDDDSIDFSKPLAVKLLNKVILNHYCGIKCENSLMKTYALQYREERIIIIT